MEFEEAIKLLRSGKKIREKRWIKNAYIYLDDEGKLRSSY